MIRVKALILILTLLSGCASTKVTILNSLVIGSTVAATESTYRGATADGYREANPFLFPFAKNRAALYGVKLASAGFICYWTNEQYKSARRFWWLPAVVNIGLNVGFSIHDYGVNR